MTMNLPIYQYGTGVLRKQAEPVQPGDSDIQGLVKDMFESMYASDGVGLAAPQIGVSIRLFVLDASCFAEEDPSLKDMKRVVINPEILEFSENRILFQEGCLSLPGIHEEVLRPDSIKARYLNEHFEPVEETFSGYAARVFQHEWDHLNGKLFTDHLSPLKKKLIQGKLKDIQAGKVKTAYKVRLPR